MNRIARILIGLSVLLVTLIVPTAVPAAAPDMTATPHSLVTTYDSLADTILAAKRTEWDLVHSILATTYGHGEAAFAEATAKIKAGKDARLVVERLATFVSQMGTEGDAAVAAVRKRLVEKGHHHNAAGEQQGIYDEGFVIVTRAAKKVFLDAAGRIGRMGRAPDAVALGAEWQKVKKQYQDLTAKRGN